MVFKIKVEFDATDKENARKIAEVLKNIIDETSEETKIDLFDLIKKKPNLFRTIGEKLKNPIFKKMFQ